jgi:hypothetical protein
MKINKQVLLNKAEDILRANQRGGFTNPTDKLYPFQWNWDSGFVSIGLAHFDIGGAISELEQLLSGQWGNGMIPHIIFHSETEHTYFPNWDFWDAAVNPGAPRKPKTSGITQPPVLGFVLEWLYRAHSDNAEILDFVKWAYPKALKSHQFWYDYRDPFHEGLVFIYHPWESGRDNSPLWDDALSLIDLEKAELPAYKRRDITLADASERPTSVQYDQYVYLMQLGKKYQYDQPGIVEESPFLIQDTLMNAILIRSNQGLIFLGKEFGLDTAQLQEWQTQSIQSFEEKLWSDQLGFYTGYDLRQKKQFPYREIGGLVPLFAGFPARERAECLKDYLEDLTQNNYFLVPSFDVEHELYDSKRYWRGPVWPQMNWMIYHGLRNFAYDELAETVRQDFLELVSRFGFFEYFEAQKSLKETSRGYGGGNFSWTASSVIDLILSA